MLVDRSEKFYLTRLMILHLAYKIERGLDFRQENSIAKTYIAHTLCDVIDTAIQIPGSLGYTHDLPLAGWLNQARANRLVDRPDEVHHGQWAATSSRRMSATARRPQPPAGTSSKPMKYTGSTAIVTGGGHGIRRAQAKTLAARGARVVVAEAHESARPRSLPVSADSR
jgi:hypothetical protein